MKMSARALFTCLLFLVVSPFSVQTFAQSSDISACRAIEDRLERFDCYERLEVSGEAPAAAAVPATPASDVNRPLTAQEQANRENLPVYTGLFTEQIAEEAATEVAAPVAAATVATAATATAAAGNDVDSFGRSGSSSADPRIVENEDGKAELVDTVAALEDRGRQRWLVTLESGQKWRQMVGKRYGLEVGDQVRIYPSGWGNSYRLAVERLGSFIQVERVD